MSLVVGGTAVFAQTALTVVRDADGVRVEGATPGGRVWLYATRRSFVDYHELHEEELEPLTDTDGDGTLSKGSTIDASGRETWLAVDEARGELATTSRLSPLPGTFLPEVTRGVDGLELQGRWFEIFLIASDEGAWRLTVMDGGPTDHDGGNPASMLASFTDWEDASGEGKAGPLRLGASDVLVVIDPVTQEIARVVAP